MATIRHARSADVPALAELMGELGYPTSQEAMGRRMETIEANPLNATFVAEIEGQVAGMIGLRLITGYEYDGPAAYISALVVGGGHRKLGVGGALLRYAEEWARRQGAEAITLTSGIKPERLLAHEFYKRQGYGINGYRFVKEL